MEVSGGDSGFTLRRKESKEAQGLFFVPLREHLYATGLEVEKFTS
jgi:hypothetical protein